MHGHARKTAILTSIHHTVVFPHVTTSLPKFKWNLYFYVSAILGSTKTA
jgi:hypothetical protein